nr:MAG TPA: hypothetical protein [Caudoviricetes sp.]
MTSAVCRLKALRGKPKAKHIESELLSAVVRTAPPASCRSPVRRTREQHRFLRCPSQEGHRGSQHALEGKTMKTVTRYEIREYKGASYSTSMSRKLRDRKAAKKLVKRLTKMGHDAFAAPLKVLA